MVILPDLVGRRKRLVKQGLVREREREVEEGRGYGGGGYDRKIAHVLYASKH